MSALHRNLHSNYVAKPPHGDARRGNASSFCARDLHEPPQSCNYANRKDVGDFLRGIMEKGGTQDWRKVLKDATGEDLSTRAMVEYFKPLMSWLEEQNKGRKIGWE